MVCGTFSTAKEQRLGDFGLSDTAGRHPLAVGWCKLSSLATADTRFPRLSARGSPAVQALAPSKKQIQTSPFRQRTRKWVISPETGARGRRFSASFGLGSPPPSSRPCFLLSLVLPVLSSKPAPAARNTSALLSGILTRWSGGFPVLGTRASLTYPFLLGGAFVPPWLQSKRILGPRL